jgi:hypothetical protein
MGSGTSSPLDASNLPFVQLEALEGQWVIVRTTLPLWGCIPHSITRSLGQQSSAIVCDIVRNRRPQCLKSLASTRSSKYQRGQPRWNGGAAVRCAGLRAIGPWRTCHRWCHHRLSQHLGSLYLGVVEWDPLVSTMLAEPYVNKIRLKAGFVTVCPRGGPPHRNLHGSC